MVVLWSFGWFWIVGFLFVFVGGLFFFLCVLCVWEGVCFVVCWDWGLVWSVFCFGKWGVVGKVVVFLFVMYCMFVGNLVLNYL